MSVKDQIKKDFGIELNIGSGSGLSSDPLQILDEQSAQASITELEYMRTISRALARLWKVSGRERVEIDGKTLLRTTLDTVHFTGSKKITEGVNYYFDYVNTGPALYPEVNRKEFLSGTCAIRLPYSIGYTHYDKTIKHDDDYMGYTYLYSNMWAKLSLSVYDFGIKDIQDGVSNHLEEQMHQAVRDVLEVNKDYKRRSDGKGDSSVLIQEFMGDENASTLIMGAKGGKFFKVRITNTNIPELNDLQNESLAQFHHLITKEFN